MPKLCAETHGLRSLEINERKFLPTFQSYLQHFRNSAVVVLSQGIVNQAEDQGDSSALRTGSLKPCPFRVRLDRRIDLQSKRQGSASIFSRDYRRASISDLLQEGPDLKS